MTFAPTTVMVGAGLAPWHSFVGAGLRPARAREQQMTPEKKSADDADLADADGPSVPSRRKLDQPTQFSGAWRHASGRRNPAPGIGRSGEEALSATPAARGLELRAPAVSPLRLAIATR